MGGSGGRSEPSREDLEAARERIREDLRRQENDAELNEFLTQQLTGYNDRDHVAVQERLDDVAEALEDAAIDFDRLLFGGSVAKHTYVDGLSDVDALVVVDDPGASPSNLVERFRDALEQRLLRADVASIDAGRLAVTVTYRDGTQIQLLPAAERDGRTSIASEDGTVWRHIRPHKFAEKLTQINAANGGAVVPTIKLAKSAISGLAESEQLSGYHVEAIAVDAFKSYNGRRDRMSMLVHLVNHAASTVTRPTGDITEQSVHIDAHLGAANSAARVTVQQGLRRLGSRLERARNASDLRSMLDD